MNRQKLYLENIVDTYPDFSLGSVRFNSSGQNNDVIIIKETFIFRFPKHTHAVKQLFGMFAKREFQPGRRN